MVELHRYSCDCGSPRFDSTIYRTVRIRGVRTIFVAVISVVDKLGAVANFAQPPVESCGGQVLRMDRRSWARQKNVSAVIRQAVAIMESNNNAYHSYFCP